MNQWISEYPIFSDKAIYILYYILYIIYIIIFFYRTKQRKKVRSRASCYRSHSLSRNCRVVLGYKTHQCRTTFGSSDVEKVHAVVARSTFPSQNVQNTTCSRHFWRFGCWKSARRCGAKHVSKPKCTKHHMFAPLLEVQMSLRFASLHYTTLHYTTLHYTTLHYTTLPSTTLHYTKLHYTTLHSMTLDHR